MLEEGHGRRTSVVKRIKEYKRNDQHMRKAKEIR
jgi:hypothetical protein